MDEETNVENENSQIERVLNSINKLKLKNTELGDYLERIANKIIDNYGNNPEQLEARLKDLERLLVHVQKLLILKETINKDIEYIKKKPTGYDYVGMINLLNTRRDKINNYIFKLNPDRREDQITNLVNQTLELFTELQMCIISTYVMQKKLVDEINQGKNTITNLWDDNFIDFVIIKNDEIARLKYCISNLYIEGTFQKERLEYLLTFESDNIRRSIELWTIVAENMGIVVYQPQYDTTDDSQNKDTSIQESVQEKEPDLDIIEGDISPEEKLYYEIKREYSFGNPENFFNSVMKWLEKIEFPKQVRKDVEKILCELEGKAVSDDSLYIPSTEEVFMEINEILKYSASPIRFEDKDGGESTLKATVSEKTIKEFWGKYNEYNTELTYTLGKVKKTIKFEKQQNMCFDNNSIYLLYILDRLFETNCLTDYINELMNKQSIKGSRRITFEIYVSAKNLYGRFCDYIERKENYSRHEVRWRFKRGNHYEGLKKEGLSLKNVIRLIKNGDYKNYR